MNKTPITWKRFKRTYTKNKSFSKKKKPKNILRIVSYIIIWFFAFVFLISLILYFKYVKDLPKVDELQNLEIAESSTIYDRNWKELYKIFKEKRTYVEFDKISTNMINAIVAWEDKWYWENPWVDIVWIFRAALYYAIWKTDWVQGTSTLTQQLIRNTIITNERSVERKVKEIFLAYSLTKGVSKEKILELYLNKISYGHNAFGVEEASKTFFDKSAIDLNILEASILASLPKWPTYYSPYNHQDRTVWYVYFYPKEDKEDIINIISKWESEQNKDVVNILTTKLSSIKWNWIEWSDKIVLCWLEEDDFKVNYSIDKDWCSVFKYSDLLTFLNNIKIESTNYFIEYQTWRKDYILQRMLEDWYINFDEYKESIINWIWYDFKQSKENIKAPHFVFYVKEYLEEKYGKEVVSVWWLEIYTTLDLDAQEKAEEIIKAQVEKNTLNFNAKNAALISIDNSNWDIISMVWWVDYFDTENKGNVNIITSKLQPWSTFKPFVYALAIYNSTIWSKTPVYDLETRFPSWYTPGNFDGTFMWKMNISTALNNSRNIPAIKMFYMAWWENSIVTFMQKLWVKSLNTNWQYWAPLALWTWEMTPLELAEAYSVFANLWKKVDINPILKIVDTKWNIIEEKKESKMEDAVSPAQSYIINKILSDKSSRPEFWNTYLWLNWREVAAKTWTSTKQYKEWWKEYIFPRNLWTIWYTPQYTTVVWAGNTDWSELNYRWNWLEWAWPIWKKYMEYIHTWKAAKTWYKQKWVEELNISEITWLLPNPENYNNNNLVSSLFVNKPTAYDNSYKTIQIDSLCNWLVTEKTPEAAIKTATILEFHSLLPSNSNWENPVLEWAKSSEAIEKYWRTWNTLTSITDKVCERPDVDSEIIFWTNIKEWWVYTVWNNYIEVAYKSSSKIKQIDILLNWEVNQTFTEDNNNKWNYVWSFFIPASLKNSQVNIEVRIVDEYFYSVSQSYKVIVWFKDNINPSIQMENPIDSSITLYDTDYFNLKAKVIDNSQTETEIFIDWELFISLWSEKRIDIAINWERNLEIWEHTIKIKSTDKEWNVWENDIRLRVIEK